MQIYLYSLTYMQIKTNEKGEQVVFDHKRVKSNWLWMRKSQKGVSKSNQRSYLAGDREVKMVQKEGCSCSLLFLQRVKLTTLDTLVREP